MSRNLSHVHIASSSILEYILVNIQLSLLTILYYTVPVYSAYMYRAQQNNLSTYLFIYLFTYLTILYF